MTYRTRWEFIQPHVRGKNVLDLGPAELVGTLNRQKMSRWIHARIREEASDLLGIEKSSEQVKALQAEGFNIRQGDAETLALGETFETVVAGELIEHLSNPGQFLDRVREHLEPEGTLILTTPNRFNVHALWQILRHGEVPEYTKPLAKHVAYFDRDSLGSLLRRHGFEVQELNYCQWVGKVSESLKARLLIGVTRRTRPDLLPVLVAAATPAPG